MHERLARQSDPTPSRPEPVARRRVAGHGPVPAPIGPAGGALDGELASRILASSGTPMAPDVQGRMSDAFGADFSAVRIHRSEIAPALSARAFTIGADVHFAPGTYRPATSTGQELLAHELSHVVQQTGAGLFPSTGRIRRALRVGASDDPAERAADRLTDAVLRGRSDGGRRSATAGGGDDVVLRRRVDTTKLGKDLAATTTEIDAYGVVAEQLDGPRNEVIEKLDYLDARRTTFANELDPLVQTVYDEIGKKPYTAANVVPPAKRAGARTNDVENRIKIADAGLAPVVSQATARQARAALDARYAEATELLAAVGTPKQIAALSRAERNLAKRLTERDFHETTTRESMGALVGALDTAEAAADPTGLMKIGTEFTFTNNLIDQLDIKDNKGQHFKAAVRLIKSWADLVAGTRIVIDRSKDTMLPAPARSERPLNWADHRKPTDGAGDKCIRFTYTLPSRKTWWWQLNIDYQCIETQTDPATRALMTDRASPDGTAVATIINSHIFAIAAGQGIAVAPHATIGGGHITIDRATAFGDNARWLRNFLVLYSNDPGKWGAEDPDVFNAPMIRELKAPGPAKFKAVIGRFDNGQITTAQDIVKALREDVFIAQHLPPPKTDDEVAANESRGAQAAHYQAINLENWDADDADGQRLEMRRFDAQTNLTELLRNVDAIIEMLLAARAVGPPAAFTW